MGSAAPLQKEEGLNSFGLATILINNSIPHSHRERERETDRQREGEGALVLCGSISLFWRNVFRIGSSLITRSYAIILQPPALSDATFVSFLFISDVF